MMSQGQVFLGSQPLHDANRRLFASDNCAGVHPQILAAINAANGGHVLSYGDDPYTHALGRLAVDVFGAGATIWPVFNGTGANVVSLDLMTTRWESVICARTAHLNTDECAAPERLVGAKLIPVDTPDGRLTPELIDQVVSPPHGEHVARPRVVTVTQSTEQGTIYGVAELGALVQHAHSRGLLVHLDGARLANAAAALGVSLGQASAELGVDVISLGGTKAGLLGCEAVVICNDELNATDAIRYLRKSTAQLASKMRFVSAQLLALYGSDLWRQNALAANAAAARLAKVITSTPGVQLTRQVQANAVFATIPSAVREQLADQFGCYPWDERSGEVRLMTSWDITPSDVDAFAGALTAAMSAQS